MLPEVAEARRRGRTAVRDFVEGAASGDLQRMVESFENLDYAKYDGGGWERAMRGVARRGSVPDVTTRCFLEVYLSHGDHIRQECDDLALLDGLRALLPPYTGRALRLYRGETFHNRARRTYGAAWTANLDVARQFANGLCRRSIGGSVLLETLAPAEAIICAPALMNDRYAEAEYVVDRRRLTTAKVLERFRRHLLRSRVAVPLKRTGWDWLWLFPSSVDSSATAGVLVGMWIRHAGL